MYYLVYKITNLINGKIYIGTHKTTNKNDRYMGSGKLLQKSIKKYGICNFIKEVVFEAPTSEEMFNKERELVKITTHTYNIKRGGEGGFDYINNILQIDKRQVSDETRKKISLSLKARYSKYGHPNLGRHQSEKTKRKISITVTGKGNANYGKTFSNEHRQKLSTAHQGQKPSPNAALARIGKKRGKYDACWITKNNKSIVVKRSLVETYLNDGWRQGRVMPQ